DTGKDASERLAALEPHDARIAQSQRPLSLARVLLLADAPKPAASVEQQASIAGRIRRLEAKYNEIGAILELTSEQLERLSLEQRCVTIDHNHWAVRFGEGRQRRP